MRKKIAKWEFRKGNKRKRKKTSLPRVTIIKKGEGRQHKGGGKEIFLCFFEQESGSKGGKGRSVFKKENVSLSDPFYLRN